MPIGIDPLVDFACRRLLGSPEHPAITLHFINAVLRGAPRITDVEIVNPMVEKTFEDDKYSVFDIRARDAHGHRFNIEIQRTLPSALPERLTYYASSQIVEQLNAGDDYAALCPSISICILDRILYRNIPVIHLDFRLMNAKYGIALTDHLQIHLLELPKYVLPSDNRVITDPIEQWCYFFRRADELTAEQIARRLPDPVFGEASGVLEMISRNPEERSLYEARLKVERDARAKLDYARREGREEGRQEGREEGFSRGSAIGKVQLLRQLLELSSPTDEELQALSLKALEALQDDLQRRLRERN